jgi:hypothetical protein
MTTETKAQIFVGIATIIAVLVGPILALLIQRLLDRLREARKKKIDIFKTLMMYRGTRLSPAFVQALNLIDLEFTKKSEKAVRDAWKESQDFYSEWGRKSPAEKESQAAQLNSRAVELLAELLVKMGASLGYPLDRVYIKKGWYYPEGLTNIELEQHALRQGLLKVLNGQSVLPVAVFEKKFPPLTIEPQWPTPSEVPLIRQSLDDPTS